MIRYSICIALLIGMGTTIHAGQAEQVSTGSKSSMSSVKLPAELDRVLRDYEQGWKSRNAEALSQLFTEDGFILRTGHPPVRGRAAIAEGYKDAGGPLFLRALDYALSDTVAYIIGAYSGGPGQPDSGKFILTLQPGKNGHWYITADMDNLNQ